MFQDFIDMNIINNTESYNVPKLCELYFKVTESL